MKIRDKLEELLKRENNKVEHKEWVHEIVEINHLVQEREQRNLGSVNGKKFLVNTLEDWILKDSAWRLLRI
jgi:hypothetical protein